MGLIANYKACRDRWQSLDMVQMVTTIMQQHKERIADYNRTQLLRGEDSEGKIFMKVAGKKERGNSALPSGATDFYETGAFHRSIFLKTEGNKFSLDATDKKRDKLVDMSSESIFGLQEENMQRVWVEILRPPLLPMICSYTGAMMK